MPVCGCDDKTYGNDCEAAAAGANIASQGECKAKGCKTSDGQQYSIGDTFPAADGCNECTCTQSGIACTKKNCAPKSCTSNADCTVAGTFCKQAAGQCGGSGTCAVKSQACIEIYSPVCGCDDKTYDNSCFANAAGTSVKATGVCPAP
ncbi:MAG: hypothetical protein KC503_08870 [Myxococcales bacterium]|nr:hypothetical protein [Myxococcales bacterium]